MIDDTNVFAALEQGRTVPVHVCVCTPCKNEFYVPGLSDEWMPSCCCFCGMKFLGRTLDGETQDFRPRG